MRPSERKKEKTHSFPPPSFLPVTVFQRQLLSELFTQVDTSLTVSGTCWLVCVCAPCTASTTQANAGPQLLLGALFMVMIWAAAAVVFLSPQYVGISVMALTTVLSFQLFLHIRLKSQAGITFVGGVCVFAQINARMRSSIRTPASVVQPCMCLCRCNRYRADSYEGRLTLLMQQTPFPATSACKKSLLNL